MDELDAEGIKHFSFTTGKDKHASPSDFVKPEYDEDKNFKSFNENDDIMLRNFLVENSLPDPSSPKEVIVTDAYPDVLH